MVLTADYVKVQGSATGNIVVTRDNGSAPIRIPTSTFFNIDFGNAPNPDLVGMPLPYPPGTVVPIPTSNSNDAFFMEEQKQLRILDMMKDGGVSNGTNIRGSVCSIMGSAQLPFGLLGNMEDKFEQIMHAKTTPYSWPKISKDSSLNPLLLKRFVSKESGLDAGYFINDPPFIGNFINVVVDPAGRSPIVTPKDQYFPGVGETLVLTPAFLGFFGLDGCRIEATLQQDRTYSFEITVPGGITINAPETNVGGQRVDWFQGNPEKNDFISILGSGANKTAIKKGLLIAKEMGDLGQILELFLWKLFSGGALYTMSTCDKVVMLQCMLMNLNCVVTSAAKAAGEKLRQIRVFRAETDPLAIKRDAFINEKNQIYAQNQKFIDDMNKLAANPSINIYTAGVTDPITFHPQFYQHIVDDLNSINTALYNYDVTFVANTVRPNPAEGSYHISSLNEIITKMKKKYLFNMFIRKPAAKLQMMLAKKYTQDDKELFANGLIQLPGYGSNPFYLIGKRFTPFAAQVPSPAGGGIQKGGGFDLETFHGLYFTTLEFDDAPALYYDKDIGPDPVNLYVTIKSQIMDSLNVRGILQQMPGTKPDFFNELYYIFYLDGYVRYDNELDQLIEQIASEFYDSFQQIQAEAGAASAEPRMKFASPTPQGFNPAVAQQQQAMMQPSAQMDLEGNRKLTVEEQEQEARERQAAEFASHQAYSPPPSSFASSPSPDFRAATGGPSSAPPTPQRSDAMDMDMEYPPVRKILKGKVPSDMRQIILRGQELSSRGSQDFSSKRKSDVTRSLSFEEEAKDDDENAPPQPLLKRRSNSEGYERQPLIPLGRSSSNPMVLAGGKRRTRKYKRKQKKTLKRRKQMKTRKYKKRARKTLKRRTR